VTDPQSLPADAASWIGRAFERSDVIDQRLVAEFTATLSPHIEARSKLPLGLHWCLAPDTLASDELGRDGHPKLGIYLPDLGLGRRMWAGGELVYHGDFTLGDTVRPARSRMSPSNPARAASWPSSRFDSFTVPEGLSSSKSVRTSSIARLRRQAMMLRRLQPLRLRWIQLSSRREAGRSRRPLSCCSAIRQ
jgi:hypothetical protein